MSVKKNEVSLNFTSCSSSIKVAVEGEKVKYNQQLWNRKIMPISIKMLCGVVVLLNVALSLPTSSAAKIPASYGAAPGGFSKAIAPGNVGCLFSKTLCDEKDEWCYDDYAFGRCLPTNGELSREDLYRYELGKGDMHSLERQMERLFATGYRWGHSYTQCVLQNLLESLRRGVDLDEAVCSDVQDQDLEGALKAFQEDIDPLNLAFIKYNPSAKNPHSDFADESYRPPKEVTYSSNGGEIVTGKELLAKESPKISLKDRLKHPVFELSAPEAQLLQEAVIEPALAEEELADTVAKVKGPAKPKTKGKNKNKNKNKNLYPVKKSILNEEYPGQSDNFNGVDIGSKKKDPATPSSLISNSGLGAGSSGTSSGQHGQQGRINIKNLIDEKLGSDAETGLGPEGVVDERILQPKIFSSSYNTPDSFRHGGKEGEEKWSESSSAREIEQENEYEIAKLAEIAAAASHGGRGSAIFAFDGDYDTGAAPGYGNDDRDQEAIREELSRLGQEEEDQQIREAVANVEAAALLNSLLLQEDNGNIFRNPSAYQDPVGYSIPDELLLDSSSQQQQSDISNSILDYPPYIETDEDQGAFYYPPQSLYQQQPRLTLGYDSPSPLNDQDNLLYTEGGLVFLKKPAAAALEEELIQQAPISQSEDDINGLNFLKRYIDQPRQFGDDEEQQEQWGPVLDEAQVEALSGNDLRFGNSEFADGYGYDFDSPLFLLNRRSRNGFGFERRERLDVKKPGPWYRTVNNYAFDKDDTRTQKGRLYESTNPEFGAAEGPADMDVPANSPAQQDTSGSANEGGNWEKTEAMQIGEVEKKSSPVKFEKSFPVSMSKFDDGRLDIIDTSYANVIIDKSTSLPVDWNAAKNFVHVIADFLDIDRNNFKEITLNDDVVTFKVEMNDKGLNASEVARRIPTIAKNVETETGIKILRADVGIRANSKTPSVLALYEDQDPVSNQIYIATFAVCGLVAAVLVAAVAIFLIRKHSKSREKLVRLSQNDPSFEACKDYQDLCRARMAGSKNNEKMEPLRGPAHKIASKESDNGTSSSRNEEPVLTNMDISTGHMVLSYMEDHLKNRDRMDQEWGSLCAYEADPCSTAVAEKAENNKKNRFSNSVPFDHSRVILNDLANVSGSDYINASTITDHDPRNPAYIATQGPLPNTAADFWQMVWEQGSVVIVNLTRLTENTTALCHRYWPEEGSELHHIYEVHLVSEHIWCDEYLVRSFYLKNLKTGETRTVTQFHFLAWPENGIPQSTKALLEFRRKVNKSYRGRSCPIIVHCSDGAGRTGTYCLIDMVLNRMTKGAKEIDIAASLEHIRDQRPGMVRTKQQFEFVLMAVAEEVHAILKALPQ